MWRPFGSSSFAVFMVQLIDRFDLQMQKHGFCKTDDWISQCLACTAAKMISSKGDFVNLRNSMVLQHIITLKT